MAPAKLQKRCLNLNLWSLRCHLNADDTAAAEAKIYYEIEKDFTCV
jgi:hypothetical protein